MTEETPKGIVFTLIDPRGHQWGTGACFEGGGAAGFSVEENQTRRAKERLGTEVKKAAMIPDMADWLTPWDAIDLMNYLQTQKGWKLIKVRVGYTEEEK